MKLRKYVPVYIYVFIYVFSCKKLIYKLRNLCDISTSTIK